MTWMDYLDFVILWATDWLRHFSLAVFLGLLAYYLTLTILSVLLRVMRISSKDTDAGCFIRFCSLLVGLSVSLASHALLDSLAIWWVTPIDPPLDLK